MNCTIEFLIAQTENCNPASSCLPQFIEIILNFENSRTKNSIRLYNIFIKNALKSEKNGKIKQRIIKKIPE